jgi:hypothetical protein
MYTRCRLGVFLLFLPMKIAVFCHPLSSFSLWPMPEHVFANIAGEDAPLLLTVILTDIEARTHTALSIVVFVFDRNRSMENSQMSIYAVTELSLQAVLYCNSKSQAFSVAASHYLSVNFAITELVSEVLGRHGNYLRLHAIALFFLLADFCPDLMFPPKEIVYTVLECVRLR